MKNISIRGAKQHNLKNLDVDIPRNKITVLTGVSGSGKSSLAFDTLYAEGQRRFVESLSSYARQFLERMPKPDVDKIEGLPPAVAIEQNPPQKNNRSTVGTVTEIYDFFRLVYGRIGKTYDVVTGEIVKKDSPQSVVQKILEWEEKSKFYILFKLPDSTEEVNREIFKYKQIGFFRIVLKDRKDILDIENDRVPNDLKPSDFYILVDRISLKKDDESITRLTDSIETAFEFGKGRITIQSLSDSRYYDYSNIYEDTVSGRVYIEPEPKLFSFNNPFGACPKCQGFGKSVGIDESRVIPDTSLSIEKGALAPFVGQSHSSHLVDLYEHSEQIGLPTNIPYSELKEEHKKVIWNGAGKYWGLNRFFQELEDKNYKVQNRVTLARYRGYTTCDKCGGARLRTSARQVFVGGKNIPEVIKMPLDKLYEWFTNIKFSNEEKDVLKQVLPEIHWRLRLLIEMGLHYLNMDRLTHTLSGGEFQRINLSTALGSSLVGTLYVLDEPSTGMHPRDTQRLISILHKLRNIGNTIVVVEHDPDIMKEADYLIDIGPKAGNFGGEITYSGNYDNMLKSKKSLTGSYLSGKEKINFGEKSNLKPKEFIEIYNARENNLDIKKVKFPHNLITVVTGVSGSGKSTLIHDILYAGIKKNLNSFNGKVGLHDKITGWEDFKEVEMVDQSSIGKSSRSTPATYTKAFDAIRDEFAKSQLSRQLGVKSGYFSFNIAGGRCDVCEGEGYVTIDMQFLSDIKLLCENCNGSRYKKEVHNIKFEGKSIVDVLEMTIDESLEFFVNNQKITKKLQVLADVGLGYLKIGQPSTMLSGGEAQRIKLATHLDSSNSEKKLFIFDEPTTGLHMDDISKLLLCFKRLQESGHTVIIIEHNLHIMAFADHIIDLGPEAGINGGKIIGEGSPEEISNLENSHTAKALKDFFESEFI